MFQGSQPSQPMSGDDTSPTIASLAREVSLLAWRVNHLEHQITRVHRIAWILLASM
jgi:hypothetical protein